MLQACGDKPEDTAEDATDTPTTSTSDALFQYECYDDDTGSGMWCDNDSASIILSDADFSEHLVDGELTEESCSNLCATELDIYYNYLCACDYQGVDSDGMHPVTCEFTQCAVEGRVHGGIQKLTQSTGCSGLGRYFARAYHAEASAVEAFLELRKELSFHNAPTELIDRCFLAAKEEVVHAQMMAKLAELHQGQLPDLSFGEFEPRTLLELALDNAVEGCIFETFSALKILRQAQKATDSVIAQTLNSIAKDECNHAELSWDIHRYLMTKLSNEEQTLVQKAQKEAVIKIGTASNNISQLSIEEQELLGVKETNLLREVFIQNWKKLAV
jgi:peroxiredoxin family protein